MNGKSYLYSPVHHHQQDIHMLQWSIKILSMYLEVMMALTGMISMNMISVNVFGAL